MFDDFLFARLVGLRMQKGVSQREMSLALGKHPNYISRIERRCALPSMESFFCICAYFDITPHEFFSENREKPALLQQAIAGLETLTYRDLMLIFLNIQQLQMK